MKIESRNLLSRHARAGVTPGLRLACLLASIALPLFGASIAIDEEAPWPRVRTTNGNTVTLHLPQVERWTSNSFVARAVIEVKPAREKKELLGVAWFEAHGSVDHSRRLVTLDRFEITHASFPDAKDGGSNALAVIREVIPAGARTVSLDYLVTALGFAEAAARKGAGGLKHDPPVVIWATNRTLLVLVDGEPALRPIAGTSLERVINTPVLLVREKPGGRFYLEADARWFAAESLAGSWALAQSPPAEVASLSSTNAPASASDGVPEPLPRIIVSTKPAELLLTVGLPEYQPIRGTALDYVADTDSQVFLQREERIIYLLLSGRWFKAASLHGPWTYVPPHELPADFAKIPANSPQAIALASVPGTRQAELALIAASVPTTATVNRRNATVQVSYDGEPKFKPIDGTTMSYAINAQLPVVRTGDEFYAVNDGVWFVATNALGPWRVAAEVPEEIYTIPPTSPVYYATFVRVYDADEENVETGYTAGYQGTYEDEGTVVYGTGCDYEPWYGDESYYSWGWTWGYCYYYIPWYQWWVWRPWWSGSTRLRAALIENIYDRWQTPGVTPHDRPIAADARIAAAAYRAAHQDFSGYPALYGRFRGPARPVPMQPPPNTLALNPYFRPQTPATAGEVPRGAQLLSTVRRSPGGGRDLYASPDGSVYLRKPDGWYRRQASGGWNLVAPAQGTIQRGQVASARSGQAGSAAGYRIAPGAGGAGAARTRDRVPDTGNRLPANEVAALERQYYARSLAQIRAQNARANYAPNRAVRGGGRRR
jgi:hypothetical protein